MKKMLACVFSILTLTSIFSFASSKGNNDAPTPNKAGKVVYIPFVSNSVHYEEKDTRGLLSFYNVCKVSTPISACDKTSKKANIQKIARYIKIRLQDNIPVALYVKLPHRNQYHVDCHVANVTLNKETLQVQCTEAFAKRDFVQLNKAAYNRVIVASHADPKISQLMKMTFGE